MLNTADTDIGLPFRTEPDLTPISILSLKSVS